MQVTGTRLSRDYSKHKETTTTKNGQAIQFGSLSSDVQEQFITLGKVQSAPCV